MLVSIDHVIVAVADLAAAAAELEAMLGLEVGQGGHHPALGTRNRLAWWGDSYLELVTVEDERAAAASWFGAAVLAALVGGEAAPVGLALASDDLVADADALALGEVTEGQRTRPDGRVVRWRVARPRSFGLGPGSWPTAFLIEHDRTAAEWTDGERAARAVVVHPLGTSVSLRSVSLAVPSVPTAVGRLGREFALLFRPSLIGGGARDATIGAQTLRIVRARPDQPLMTIDLRGGREARELDLLGCRWRFAPT